MIVLQKIAMHAHFVSYLRQMFKVKCTGIYPLGSNPQSSNRVFFSPPALSSFLLSRLLSLPNPNWRNGDVSRNESMHRRQRYLLCPRRLRHLPPALLYSTRALLAISVFCLCIPVPSTHSRKTHAIAHTRTRTLKSLNVTDAV